MKGFKLDFQNLIGGAEQLLPLMEDKRIPSVINIKNIQSLVIPKALSFFDYFTKPIFKSPKVLENSIITIEDFNTYDIVKVERAHINILSAVKTILSIDLFVDHFNRSFLVGTLKSPPTTEALPPYRYLTEVLPFDLSNEVDNRILNVVSSSLQVISFSTALLTFLYTMYNLDGGIEIVSIVSSTDRNGRAIDYIYTVRNRLKVTGRNFIEAVENLRILHTVLL
jgi:hypothetical protein